MSKKVVHYINQFYAGIGGEEKAGTAPFKEDGPKGPGLGLNPQLQDAEIVGTVVCGDDYFNEKDSALNEVMDMIKSYDPDLVILGPAFNAGRYGMACGKIGATVMEELDIPAVTGLYEENPGTDIYRTLLYVTRVGDSAVAMRDAIPTISNLANKLLAGEDVDPAVDAYHERFRKNYFTEKRGSERAVDMLVAKLNDEEFKTEFVMPDFDRVDPETAIEDLSKATIAIVTSGGMVPAGNPDRIESSSASKFGAYSIEGLDDLVEGEWETAHGGFDNTYANEDADRVIPVDVMRSMEKDGIIGKLYDTFYSTVGNGTSVANSKAYGEAIGKELKDAGVDAVLLTST